MDIVIERIETAEPELAAFLLAHHQDMAGTAPPESQHALPFERLLMPGVRLFATMEGGRPIATGALATVEDGHEELKSMRTDPAQRGRGLARTMLEFLIADAAARDIHRISLETGSMDFFIPARRLYASAGFEECEAFGRYRPDPLSTFMTLSLEDAAVA
ncbi:GNAT family N-acetyltransferase [Microbacterium sp.]|uniref:GNAT family N-acetyltransferase n=1 Tax=Microbacterium sp. TaxID=51671 RepID=UPI002FDFF34A